MDPAVNLNFAKRLVSGGAVLPLPVGFTPPAKPWAAFLAAAAPFLYVVVQVGGDLMPLTHWVGGW